MTCDAKLILDNIHNWLPIKVSKGGKEKDNWRSLNLHPNVYNHWICFKWGNFNKNITYNFIFEIYFSFCILCDEYYFGQNMFIAYKIFIFYEFLLKNSISQIFYFSNLPKVHNIFIKFGVHILSKFWNAKNCTLWQQFWEF